MITTSPDLRGQGHRHQQRADNGVAAQQPVGVTMVPSVIAVTLASSGGCVGVRVSYCRTDHNSNPGVILARPAAALHILRTARIAFVLIPAPNGLDSVLIDRYAVRSLDGSRNTAPHGAASTD